jgi:hypothetical protein
MRRFLTPLVAFLALVALFAGCSSHPPLSGVTVELTKLERASDGSLTATLSVVNSTVVSFNIANSKHQLSLNGLLVGTIEISEPLGLPAQRTMTQTGLLKLAGAKLTAGSATYRLESSATLLLYGESKETQKLTNTGTVQVP